MVENSNPLRLIIDKYIHIYIYNLICNIYTYVQVNFDNLPSIKNVRRWEA